MKYAQKSTYQRKWQLCRTIRKNNQKMSYDNIIVNFIGSAIVISDKR